MLTRCVKKRSIHSGKSEMGIPDFFAQALRRSLGCENFSLREFIGCLPCIEELKNIDKNTFLNYLQ